MLRDYKGGPEGVKGCTAFPVFPAAGPVNSASLTHNPPSPKQARSTRRFGRTFPVVAFPACRHLTNTPATIDLARVAGSNRKMSPGKSGRLRSGPTAPGHDGGCTDAPAKDCLRWSFG